MCTYLVLKSYLPSNVRPPKKTLEMLPITHGVALMDHSNWPQTFCHDCPRILSSLLAYPSGLSFVPILQYQPAPTHMEALVILLGQRRKKERETKILQKTASLSPTTKEVENNFGKRTNLKLKSLILYELIH